MFKYNVRLKTLLQGGLSESGFYGDLVYTERLLPIMRTRNIDCGYSLEPPRRGDSNEYLQSTF